MTDERRQRAEIEAGESWLRTVDVGLSGPDVDAVKRRLRKRADELRANSTFP